MQSSHHLLLVTTHVEENSNLCLPKPGKTALWSQGGFSTCTSHSQQLSGGWSFEAGELHWPP